MTLILQLPTPDGNLDVAVEPTRRLQCPVYWPFTELHAALSRDADDLHRFSASNYAGSSHFLGDEGFVFDPADGMLTGLFLRVPENNGDGARELQRWLNAPTARGLLRLQVLCKFSVVSPCDFRYLSGDGRFLLCVPDIPVPENVRMRVLINERVSLLFGERSYCGFLLERPVRSLVRFDGSFGDADRDLQLDFMLKPLQAYLELVQEGNWNLLENADQNARGTLLAVQRELEGRSDEIEPVYALRERCRILLEDYFSG